MAVEQLQNQFEDKTAALIAAEKQIAKLKQELTDLREIASSDKKSEQALGDANNRLTELISNLQNGVFVVDENRKVVIINERFCKQFEITAPSASLIDTHGGAIIEQISHLFKDPAGFVSRANQLVKDKKIALKDELELADGKVFYQDYIPVFVNGNYRGHMWKYTDVTESKTIEANLDAQRKFYEQILSNIPVAIGVLGPDFRYRYFNLKVVNDTNKRNELIGKSDEEYCISTNKLQSVCAYRHEIFQAIKESKKPQEWEEEITKPDGSIESRLNTLYPVLDDNNNLEMVIGYGVDIKRNKKIEEQIKLSEKRYKNIFNFSLAWICTHDMEGRIITINAAACNILKYSEQQLIGKKIGDLVPERVRSQFSETYMQTILTEGKAEGIMSILNSEGNKFYLLYQNYLVKEPGVEPYVIGFSQNITERIYAEKALKRSEEKYRGIIENMNLGMTEIDNEERIIYANQRFCTMSGYGLEELVGKKATDLFLEGSKQKLMSNHIFQRQYGVTKSYEVAVKTKNNENHWWLISAAPLLNEDETVRGTIGVHLDITKQKKLQQQLREAKSDADKSSRSKDIFLTNMSHEIRTPLNAIMGLGKLLSKSDISAQQKYYLNGIESASENLLGIINDLLDFSKIEAGKITIENISFNLEHICQQVVNILMHKTEEKGLLLTQEVDERIAPVLLGDPYRINQVFMNMFGNAIKFTEHGSISLKASLVEEADDWQKILITIQDTGIGIKDEYIDQLFDKFTQEDETVVRKFGGTGLGMSITKQLMELMGGSITVESKKNVGTTIILNFKFKIGISKVIEKKKTIKNDTSNISGKRILLVEDNNLNRLLAHTILTEYGAMVTEAINGLESIELMKKHSFDIVLMDIQMPVMDGIQATQIIRKEINATIPIIALTANAVKGKLEGFLQAGMDDFIYKPYDEIKLVNPIAKWLNKPASSQPENKLPDVGGNVHVVSLPIADTLVSPVAVTEVIVPDGPLYDLATLKNIGRNDMGFITKMLQLFIEETPPATLKIKEAYEAGDFATVKYLSHRIKPSITNMGIASIKNEILQIELQADKAAKTPALENYIEKVHKVIEQVVIQLNQEYALL